MGFSAEHSLFNNDVAHCNLLVYKGELGISSIRDISAEAEKVSGESKPLYIRLSEVESVDIAFLQMLFAIKKERAEKKLQTNIEAVLRDDLYILICNNALDVLFDELSGSQI